MTVRVIALDPGGTTGWASYTKAGPDFEEWSGGHLGPAKHHKQLGHLIEHQAVHDYTVVCESFEFRQGRQRANLNLMSKEYIGVAEYICQDRAIPLVMQTASLGKSFVTDEKLKVMGMWVPGMKHQMDALRHLITYLVRERKMHHLLESWKGL